jgi:TolB-like protein
MADERPFLVPVVIDETSEQGASVPELFRAVQWTLLPSGEMTTAFTGRVSRLLSMTVHALAMPDRLSSVTTLVSLPVSLALPDKPSIAVLPFTDMTGGKGGGHFIDGLADEITTALSRFSSLYVIANSSTLAYRGEVRNLRQISRELGVRYLLEGGVREAGEQVRISVKLADAIDNLPFWNQKFDGPKGDDFALQDRIANTIASQIEPKIVAQKNRRHLLDPLAKEANGLAQLRIRLNLVITKVRCGRAGQENAGAVGCKDDLIVCDSKPSRHGHTRNGGGVSRMGLDPNTSVLNGHNQAHDIPNFVCDLRRAWPHRPAKIHP